MQWGMAQIWYKSAKIEPLQMISECWKADLYRSNCWRVQLGAILDSLGSEDGDELLKGQLHIVPLTSFGVKAPAEPHLVCESKLAGLFMVD